jgi:hypothetical protein
MSHTSWKLSFYLHNNKQPEGKIRDGSVDIRTGPAKAAVGRMSTEDDEVELEHQRRGFTGTFGNDFQRKAGSPTSSPRQANRLTWTPPASPPTAHRDKLLLWE